LPVKFEIITSMNKKLYDQVGKTMVDSFLKNWPEEIGLTIYREDEFEFPSHSRLSVASILDDSEYVSFMKRHKNRHDQSNPLELHRGAVRFAGKSFTVFTHCLTSDKQFVIWLDADTETFNPVTKDFINSLVREGVYVTYLGREETYSECGFVIYNTKHFKNEDFMDEWRSLYELDRIFSLPEWHDSYLFDWLRYRHLEKEEELNLSPWGRGYEHVFNSSCIGAFIDHKKGPRKEVGHSYYSDLNMRVATKEAIERYSKWK